MPATCCAPLRPSPFRCVFTENIPHNAKVTLAIGGGSGWVSPELAPWLRTALEEGSREAFGNEVAFAGEGGSIPFLAALGERFPKVQFVATGVLGPDSNAHGIDEMLDLDCCVAVTNAMSHVIAAHAAKGE